MKTVGRRIPRPVTFHASGEALREGARFCEELQRLPFARLTGIPKGVRRFATHEEQNRYDLDCAARRMAQVSRRRA
jgi:hypothetical protein